MSSPRTSISAVGACGSQPLPALRCGLLWPVALMPHMGRTHAMRTRGYAAVLRSDVDGSAPRLIAFESPASCLLATDLDRLADTWVRQRESGKGWSRRRARSSSPRIGCFLCISVGQHRTERSIEVG